MKSVPFLLSPKILHDSTVNTPQQSLRVPQSAPSIVKVPSEELSEPLLRFVIFGNQRIFNLPSIYSVLGATKSDMILEIF